MITNCYLISVLHNRISSSVFVKKVNVLRKENCDIKPSNNYFGVSLSVILQLNCVV